MWWISLQAHAFFEGVEWDKLYQMEAAFIPEVNDELDTQNFEKFDEVSEPIIFSLILCTYLSSIFHIEIFSFYLLHLQTDNQSQSSRRAGPWRKVISGIPFSVRSCHQVICRFDVCITFCWLI